MTRTERAVLATAAVVIGLLACVPLLTRVLMKLSEVMQ